MNLPPRPAHPHRGGQLRRVADEPGVGGVLRGAGLARRRLAAASAAARAGAADCTLSAEDLGDQPGGLLVEHTGSGRRRVLRRSTLPSRSTTCVDEVGRRCRRRRWRTWRRPTAMSSGVTSGARAAVDEISASQRRVRDAQLAAPVGDHVVEADDLAEADEGAVRRAQRLAARMVPTPPAAAAEVLDLVGLGAAAGFGNCARAAAVDRCRRATLPCSMSVASTNGLERRAGLPAGPGWRGCTCSSRSRGRRPWPAPRRSTGSTETIAADPNRGLPVAGSVPAGEQAVGRAAGARRGRRAPAAAPRVEGGVDPQAAAEHGVARARRRWRRAARRRAAAA